MTGHLTVNVDVSQIPEVVHGLIATLAKILRDEADADGNPEVARKLREIAARFEAGQ